jgi:hypothetical protein
MELRACHTSFMQTSEIYMIGGVPASINSAIPPYQSHATQNGVTPEHAGALVRAYDKHIERRQRPDAD